MDVNNKGYSDVYPHGKVLQVPDTEQFQDGVSEPTAFPEHATGNIFQHWPSDMHLLLLL